MPPPPTVSWWAVTQRLPSGDACVGLHAAGELRSVLPEAPARRLDLSTLKLEPASFVDAEMAHCHADLLFSASIAGRPSYIIFLFEHQSEPDDPMPWRLLTYQYRIWTAVLREEPKRKTLPPILTLVAPRGERLDRTAAVPHAH